MGWLIGIAMHPPMRLQQIQTTGGFSQQTMESILRQQQSTNNVKPKFTMDKVLPTKRMQTLKTNGGNNEVQ